MTKLESLREFINWVNESDNPIEVKIALLKKMKRELKKAYTA